MNVNSRQIEGPGIFRLHWNDGTFTDIEGTSFPNALRESGILPEPGEGSQGPPENLQTWERISNSRRN